MKRSINVAVRSGALLICICFVAGCPPPTPVKPLISGLFNIYWDQTDFEQGVAYDGLQIAHLNLQQVTCDVVVINLDWGDGTIANAVQTTPFPTPPGTYPIYYKPTGSTFPAVTQYQTVMHAFAHQVGAPPGNTPMDFSQTITTHPRTPIDHVVVPASVVGGKAFNITVDVTTPAQSWLTRVDFKWKDPKGLIVVNNQPVSVQRGLYEVVVPFQTKATPKNEDVEVTISTLPDNLITKKIKIKSH